MINYPVDTNSRWSIWSINDAEIKKHNKPWPRADGMEIVGLDADLVPLLEVDEARPAYDADTHKLEKAIPAVDVNANTHTHGWNIVALSQAELDAKAQAILDAQERAIAFAKYQDLKDGTGTQLERLVRVEQVCAHLLKERYKDP